MYWKFLSNVLENQIGKQIWANTATWKYLFWLIEAINTYFDSFQTQLAGSVMQISKETGRMTYVPVDKCTSHC